jgi:predicted ArsR family transcriptional regulator
MMKRRKLFTDKVHANTQARAARSQATQYPLDWLFTHEVISPDEYITTYTQCAVCQLAKQEDCFDLAKYLCKIDFITYPLMGAHLDRTMTLADGDDVCDFHVTRKVRTSV